MKKIRLILITLLFPLINFAQTGEIISYGIIDCFKEGTINKDSSLCYCEASAVLYHNHLIYIASDKNIPEHSSVFSFDYAMKLNSETIKYLDIKELKNAVKYEDFTITPDKKFVFLITGFDRIDSASNKLDKYNTLFYWPSNSPEKVSILMQKENQTVISSVPLRKKISLALKNRHIPFGAPYFKIEGLAATPNNTLLFGIREYGESFDDFRYAIKIISVTYKVNNDKIELNDDYKLVYNFKSDKVKDIIHPVALSSIEYDTFNNRLYLTTSYELSDDKGGMGAYLWTIPMNDFAKNAPATLVLNKDGKPLTIRHKVEGVTVIDKETVFLICDDDRDLGKDEIPTADNNFKRKPNQAVYYQVKIK